MVLAKTLSLGVAVCATTLSFAAQHVVYIHGDVAPDGTVPSGDVEAFQPMLLEDSGKEGLSEFKALVEGEGFAIESLYDRDAVLDSEFLNQVDVLVFGLHQRIWTESEKAALGAWLKAGGGILIYSDSASGGHYNEVGIANTVGQTVVNNLIADYGMQVAVDHGAGTRSYHAPESDAHPVVAGLVIEGEGVSPVAVDPAGGAEVLIACEDTFKVGGSKFVPTERQNITIPNPLWAAVAHRAVGKGHIIVLFDRQPMWNAGPGSDITRKDNRELLRRIVRFLAGEEIVPEA